MSRTEYYHHIEMTEKNWNANGKRFADSCCSWQKGAVAVENVNKLIRQYIPKSLISMTILTYTSRTWQRN